MSDRSVRVKVYAVLLIDKESSNVVAGCLAARPRITDRSGGKCTQALLDMADGPDYAVAKSRLMQKLMVRNCSDYFASLPAVIDE